MDKLIDSTLIRKGCITTWSLCCLFNRNESSSIGSMGRSTYHIKFCRIRRIFAFKVNFFCSLGNVQTVLISHSKFLSISSNLSFSANIENTDLTAFQKIVGSKVLPTVNAFFNRNLLRNRHTSHCDHTVYMGIHCNYLICLIQVLDQKFLSQLFCCIAFYISLVCRITNIHFLLSPFI